MSRPAWEAAILLGLFAGQLSAALGPGWASIIALGASLIAFQWSRSQVASSSAGTSTEASLPVPKADTPEPAAVEVLSSDALRPAPAVWLIDTSALVDGRVLALIESGLRPDRLVVPREVLAELHHLADKSAKSRRERGRRGQEIAARLRELCGAEWQEESLAEGAVDEELITLARRLGARLISLDRGLLDRARAEGLRVLAIQDLASAMQQPVLPGTRMDLELVKKGEGKDQAVGYCSDGTMVVVDGASAQLGEKVAVEVKSSIRTRNGTLVFARLAEKDGGEGE